MLFSATESNFGLKVKSNDHMFELIFAPKKGQDVVFHEAEMYILVQKYYFAEFKLNYHGEYRNMITIRSFTQFTQKLKGIFTD